MNEVATNDGGFKKIEWQLPVKEREAIRAGAQAQALNFAKSFLDVNFLLLAQDIKARKLYRHELDEETGESFNWAAYCTKKWGRGHATVDSHLALLNQCGREFVDALAGMSLPRRSVRLMLDAPPEMQAQLLDLENAPEDERQTKLDALVDQIREQSAVVEDLGHTIEAKLDEIERRKRAESKLEDTLAARLRDIRELRADWTPSAEEAAGVENMGMENAVIRACLRRINAQVEALPDCAAIHTVGLGVRDNLVAYADELAGVLFEVTKAAKTK